MKLMRKYIFLLLGIIALFCSCKDSSSSNCSQCSGITQSDEINPAAVKDVLNEDTAPFHVALPCEVTVYGSGNAKGFYEVFSNNDLSKNIMYTDYATQKQIYLCSQPSCAHNNEICTSWIPPGEYTVYPVALDEGIALLYSGRNDFSKIEIADANGANRKILTEFGSGVEIDPGAAVNDKYIVVKTTSYFTDDNEQINIAQELLAVDLSNGKRYKLCTTDDMVNISPFEPGYLSLFFRGVSESGFIVKTIRVNDYAINENVYFDESFALPTNSQEHTIYEIPFDGSKAKKLLTFHQNECFDEVYGDSLFYLKNNGENQYSLEKINTQTLEHNVIVSDFRQTNIQTNISEALFSDTFLVARVEDFVILNTLSSNIIKDNGDIELVYKSYAIDINTGKMHELTLSNYFSATQLPVSIIAQTDTKLLVHAKIEEVQKTGTQVQMTERLAGLISKEDYLNSQPNYVMINALRKPM